MVWKISKDIENVKKEFLPIINYSLRSNHDKTDDQVFRSGFFCFVIFEIFYLNLLFRHHHSCTTSFFAPILHSLLLPSIKIVLLLSVFYILSLGDIFYILIFDCGLQWLNWLYRWHLLYYGTSYPMFLNMMLKISLLLRWYSSTREKMCFH